MEARIARLEADVGHLRAAANDIKSDVRALRDRIDTRFDAVHVALAAIKDGIAAAKIWALLLYFALAAGMLGAMARGFGWI